MACRIATDRPPWETGRCRLSQPSIAAPARRVQALLNWLALVILPTWPCAAPLARARPGGVGGPILTRATTGERGAPEISAYRMRVRSSQFDRIVCVAGTQCFLCKAACDSLLPLTDTPPSPPAAGSGLFKQARRTPAAIRLSFPTTSRSTSMQQGAHRTLHATQSDAKRIHGRPAKPDSANRPDRICPGGVVSCTNPVIRKWR